MTRWDNWTLADEMVIREMFRAGCEDCHIAERLGRTLKAVEGRRTRMGLYRVREREAVPRAVQRGRAWTPEETEMCVSAINMGWDNDRIGALLGRTAQSIKGKRETLASGVQRRNASAVASIEAASGWPRANAVERARGERLLDRAFGGKPRVDARPVNAMHYSVPRDAFSGFQSSANWAVAQ